MGIISWIVLGLVVGVLAKWIMPGNDPGGFIVTVLIGIVGALIGGFIIGVVEALGGLFLGQSLGQCGIFLIFILVLIFRPTGLLGHRA